MKVRHVVAIIVIAATATFFGNVASNYYIDRSRKRQEQ